MTRVRCSHGIMFIDGLGRICSCYASGIDVTLSPSAVYFIYSSADIPVDSSAELLCMWQTQACRGEVSGVGLYVSRVCSCNSMLLVDKRSEQPRKQILPANLLAASKPGQETRARQRLSSDEGCSPIEILLSGVVSAQPDRHCDIAAAA